MSWWRRAKNPAILVPPPGAGYEIRSEWKELVHYIEGEHRHTFDAGWGVTPNVLYIPDPSIWDRVVPDWLVGRYDEVHARLVASSGHVVEPTVEGFHPRP